MIPKRESCCWPECTGKRSRQFPMIPLCDLHTVAVHDQVAAVWFRPSISHASGPRTRPGTIYYLLIDDLVKIGFAATMEGRMTAYPPSSVLLAAHPGYAAQEQEIHQALKRHRARGREWYHANDELLATIEAIQPGITPMMLSEFRATWSVSSVGRKGTPPYPWLVDTSNEEATRAPFGAP